MQPTFPRTAAFVLMLSAPPALADWPEFRGPSAQGIIAAKNIPTVWSPTKNVRWRTPLPGEGWSSPIVVGNSLYVTTAIPGDESAEPPNYELALLILDVRSGRLIRRVALFTQEGASAPSIHKKNSHASPTPLFDGRNIYVHFGHQGTACTTPDGQVLWRNDSLGYPPVHGNGGSPVVVDDLLIFSRDGGNMSEVTALDKMTGRLVWQVQRDVEVQKQFSFCTPLVIESAGRKQLIIPGSNVVQSLDPATGKEYWRLYYEGYSVVPRPIYESGLVFVCTGYNRPSLLAIDPTGSGDVTATHLKWRSSSNIPNTPSLVAYQGLVAMVSDKGIAICFDAVTGKEIWKERIGGNFSASPLLVGSHMYLLSEEGNCTILDIAGQPREIAKNGLGERCLASPAIVDNDILIRTAKALVRISDKSNPR